MTEKMVRAFFEDRHLGELLGDARAGEEQGFPYIEFEYKQPHALEARGVDWLDTDMSCLVQCGHGTYWETLPHILARGSLKESDGDRTFGEHEWHKVSGVYITPQWDAWATHYSWPCNVFGNKAFYGAGCRVLANDKFLKKVFDIFLFTRV